MARRSSRHRLNDVPHTAMPRRQDTMLLLAAIAVMLAAVASCARPGTIYHHYVSVDDDGWDTCSYAVFTFDIDSAMSGGAIDIDIELRLRPTYSFANLWLEASDNASVPADYAADTLQLRTADDAGVRAGTFSAGLYSLSLPYKHIESVRPTYRKCEAGHHRHQAEASHGTVAAAGCQGCGHPCGQSRGG